MAENINKIIRVGQKVEIPSKQTYGIVAYFGTTHFSQGKWVGVILDEPVGKNNGTVQGKVYFECEENCGCFLRPTQVSLVDDAENLDLTSSSTMSDKLKSSFKRKIEPTRLPVVYLDSSSPTISNESMTDFSFYTPAASFKSVQKAKTFQSISRKPSLNASLYATPSNSFTKKPKSLSITKTGTFSTTERFPTTKVQTDFKLPLGSMHKSPRSEKQLDTSPRQDHRKSASFVETTGNVHGVSSKLHSKKNDSGKGGDTTMMTNTSTERLASDSTGFVETLTPQFTPGVPSPSMHTLEDKANALLLQQENEHLKNELKDFQEKLESLREKRNQDKEKIKEGDKLKLQFEKFIEFKSRIIETQSSLQKELQKSKQDCQQAIESKEMYVEETQELVDSVEMLTLDKEMAEEKCEALQLELETVKEKMEELQVDLDIMRNQEDDSEVTVASDATSKQLQQQNDRLRETLVRMRDLSAHDKHEMQKQQKDMDAIKSEATELSRTKEKLSTQISTLEATITDLQEQVDAALGAEEMVETLTERNLDMEERVEELQEAVADLEAINDTNDQLLETARDLELELREDLDLANAKIRTITKEQEAVGEVIADQESTIFKFRELVGKLQQQNNELRYSLEKETNKPIITPSEIIDFKKMFTDSKAHGKAIEMELRKLEVNQANKHVSYLMQYLPNSFICRGGDHEAVSVLLLLLRTISKCDIIIGCIRDRITKPEIIDRNAVMKSHSVDQFCYSSRFLHLLYMLQGILQQYLHIANSCSVDVFLQLGTFYHDMQIQEKNIDIYVEFLKKDQLAENTSTEPLEKCINYYNSMYQLNLSGEKMQQARFLSDVSRTIFSSSDTISSEADRIKALIMPTESGEEFGKLMAKIKETSNEIGTLAKRIRRRMPEDGSMGPMSYSNEVQESLFSIITANHNVVKVIHHISKACMQQTALIADIEGGISNSKLKEFIHQATDFVYGQEDQGPESIINTLTKCLDEVTRITNAVENGEYDFDGTVEKEAIPPMSLRAESIKKEINDTEHLKFKLEHREGDVKEFKLLIKQKGEELSQMTVRRDMAEKRLSTATRDADLLIEKLQRKLDDALIKIKSQEKEYAVTTDHLQADIDSLTAEKGDLRKKIAAINKDKLYQALNRSNVPGNISTSSPTIASVPSPTSSSSITVIDSPLLLQQIKDLKKALSHMTDKYYAMMASDMKQKMASLKPLEPPKMDARTERRNELLENCDKIRQKLNNHMLNVKVVDISKRKPGNVPAIDSLAPAYHIIRDQEKLNKINEECLLLREEIAEFLAQRTPGGAIKTALATFPSTQLVKAYSDKSLINIGSITIGKPKTDDMTQIVLDKYQIALLLSLIK